MAVDTEDSARESTTTTRFWNDPRIRSIIYQILVVLVVVLTGWFLYSNLIANLAQRGIATGYDFLSEESGFAIAEHFISYSAADTYGRAFIVGILNTLRVAALGIVLATIIGTIVGIARLSSNWLIAKLATVYVEGLRNIPVLLWLFIWYAVITVSLPHPRVAIMPIEGIVLSNRGLMFAVPADHPIHLWMWIAFFVGLAITWFIRRWAARRQSETGQQFPAFRAGLAAIIGLPLIVWLIGGAPTDMDVPTLQGFNFAGGVTFTPEFAAVLFGLTFYTASFIAEIVRSGIQAVSYGQTEAAGALGLRPTRVLRLVVLPQALRIIIPPTTSQYLNLTKNSSLAVAVGYPDLVSVGNTTLNQTGQAIEAISIYMLVYLTISLFISLSMNIYDKRIALVER